MRNLIIKDTKIDKDELFELIEKYQKFWNKHTGITPEFYIEQRDFTSVPTSPDNDGDLKPTYKYRQELATDVHKRYGDYGVDNIIMLVHEDNFLFKGIWGVNYSYRHYKYCFQLCRWDKDRQANSFGTLFHEQMHSLDALIKQETGFDIAPLFGGDWDKYVVHGGRPDEVGKYDWDYINYQQNTDALQAIAKHLQNAYEVRKKKHQQVIIKMLNVIVRLLEFIIGNKNKR